MGVTLKPAEDRSTIILNDLRGALNLSPIMPRDANFSNS